MNYIRKIEIAGVVQTVRNLEPAKYFVMVVNAQSYDFTVALSHEAYDHWVGKIFDGDYVHLLAEAETNKCDIHCAQIVAHVHAPEMIIRHVNYFWIKEKVDKYWAKENVEC